jgi:CRISPR/Cas system CSM-associated protein Csm3 (group 7 of RAMP superfamily)
MKKNYRINVTLLSAMHINAGADKSGLRLTAKSDGKPYIPATLFKGRVRWEFSALSEALGENSESVTEYFFGSGGFCRSHTIFDNLYPVRECKTELRTNVSIDRYTRKAAEGALVTTEVVAQCGENGEPTVFSGEMTVYFTDESMLRYEPALKKAVELVCTVGLGKSRGLGFVRTEIAEIAEREAPRTACEGGRKYVEFMLESDVMTGGVRNAHDRNFLVSENVISGQVLRAAFANDVLADCLYAGEEVDGKANFVAYRGKEACEDCKNADVCRKFSDMSFSALMKENSLPAPFTLRVCKTDRSHPLMDTIAGSGKLKCPECLKNTATVTSATGRMENAKGFVDRDGNGLVKPKRGASMHTSVDPYTGTVVNGNLFSVESLGRGQVYCGMIDDCGSGMLYEGAVIYVGKFSSNGFGKLRITKISQPEERDVLSAIDDFNARFGEKLAEKYGGGKRFAAVLLTSDAKLDIASAGGIMSSEEYRAAWEKALFGGKSIRLEQIYAQTFTWSGYDTSSSGTPADGAHKPTELITEKGTSLLVSFPEGEEDSLVRLEREGVGADRNIGYGEVLVCGKLHSLGIKTEENA